MCDKYIDGDLAEAYNVEVVVGKKGESYEFAGRGRYAGWISL